LLRDKIGQTVKLTVRRGSEEKVIDTKVVDVELSNFRLVENTESHTRPGSWRKSRPGKESS
jgi:hypothetical protein